MAQAPTDQEGWWGTQLWKSLLCQGGGELQGSEVFQEGTGVAEMGDVGRTWGLRLATVYQQAQKYFGILTTQPVLVCTS